MYTKHKTAISRNFILFIVLEFSLFWSPYYLMDFMQVWAIGKPDGFETIINEGKL